MLVHALCMAVDEVLPTAVHVMRSGPLVIVGDTMLDVDLEGSATRLSPEAPVPVIDAEQSWHRPGGAGLAAMLAARHEDDVVLITGIAPDAGGDRVRDLLRAAGVRVLALPMVGGTVTKTRVRAGDTSVLRVDQGDATYVPQPVPPRCSTSWRRPGRSASPTTAAG